MKTKLLTLLMLIVFGKTFSQSFDNYTKLEVIDKTHLKITNEQDCATTFHITLISGRTFTTGIVQPDSSTIFVLDVCCMVSVYPITHCTEAIPGVVSVNTCDFVLPIGNEVDFTSDGQVRVRFQNNPVGKKFNLKIVLSDGSVRDVDFPLNDFRYGWYYFKIQL